MLPQWQNDDVALAAALLRPLLILMLMLLRVVLAVFLALMGGDVAERSVDGDGGSADADDAVVAVGSVPVPDDESQAANMARLRRRKKTVPDGGLRGRADAVSAESVFGFDAHVGTRAEKEKEFAQYFADLVSEWNPCFDEDGVARFQWDEGVGAHNVEVWGDLVGTCPERVNLRERIWTLCFLQGIAASLLIWSLCDV